MIDEINGEKVIYQTLESFFEKAVADANNIDPYYGNLLKELQRLHSSGGKRIRPKLVLLAYQAFGGQDSELIAEVASAYELLHFCMLIHDDIIDRDTIRYGVKNITGSFDDAYAPFVHDPSERRHYANSAALLAGDLMLSGAHNMINTSQLDDSKKVAVQSMLYKSLFQVAGGEFLDTETAFRPHGAIDTQKITQYKTASYSFIGPLTTGAFLADASPQDIETLERFALQVGIAFQLADDLLGVFGDESKTGKSSSGDIREGKWTYIMETLVSTLSDAQKEVFDSYFGNKDASPEQINQIKQLLIENNIKEKVDQKMQSHVASAKEELTALDLSAQAHSAFEALLDKMTKREF